MVPPDNYTVRPLHDELVRELLATLVENEEAPIPQDHPSEAEALLHDALRERASDIHLDFQLDGMLVRFRIDGRVLDGAYLTLAEGQRLTNQLKALAGLTTEQRHPPEEARITFPLDGQQLDLRVAHVPCLHGDKMAIRLFTLRQHPEQPQQLHELGLHEKGLEHIHEWLGDISGMLLVAGPTGGGKTTTLYSLLHRLKIQERNIVTIEDPVEYHIEGINHIQVDVDHQLGFPEGIKAMLRMDPDYLMIGEIRDAPSAHAAIAASASGRAMMSTLHSRDAVGVIDALRNLGLTGHEISANLVLVIAQRLVRRLCPHCKQRVPTDRLGRQWLETLGRTVPDSLWQAEGCGRCRALGYLGMTGVFEVWRIDPEEYQLILDGADRRTLYRQLAGRGHRFLLDDGLDKAEDGITDLKELRGMGGFSALPTIDRPDR